METITVTQLLAWKKSENDISSTDLLRVFSKEAGSLLPEGSTKISIRNLQKTLPPKTYQSLELWMMLYIDPPTEEEE